MASKPADHRARASQIVAALTVEQKAAITSGASFWETVAIADAGIAALTLTDGPHGIRKQVQGADALGLNDSVVAVCFPPAVALAAAFDPALAGEVGDALGRACLAEKVGVLLGPGINMKRSALGGRNFEYYAEDPFLAGRMAAAYVRGVQQHGVGTSVKHFAANNQETERFRVSADIDPRPLHEIYLRAFEYVVRSAQPWSVMAAYNKLNGTYATEDHWLLTDTLRRRWGSRESWSRIGGGRRPGRRRGRGPRFGDAQQQRAGPGRDRRRRRRRRAVRGRAGRVCRAGRRPRASGRRQRR